MRAWVVGAKGMLGGEICRQLKAQGVSYVGTDIEVDITDRAQVERFAKSESLTHLINCAAYTDVDGAERERELAFHINVEGPRNLGSVANETGFRVVHFSTDYVFDGRSSKPYREEAPGSPLGVYGETKWKGEQALLEACPSACIVRTSWLCHSGSKNFVTSMLRLMVEREELSVVADQRGRPCFCEDLAGAALQLLDQSGVFHFANSGETTWHRFACTILEEARWQGFPLKTERVLAISTADYGAEAPRPAYSVLDTSKVESLLKRPPRPWQEALRACLQQISS